LCQEAIKKVWDKDKQIININFKLNLKEINSMFSFLKLIHFAGKLIVNIKIKEPKEVNNPVKNPYFNKNKLLSNKMTNFLWINL